LAAGAGSTSSSSALFLGLFKNALIYLFNLKIITNFNFTGPQEPQLVQVNVKSEMPVEQQPAATHKHNDQDMLAMVEAQQWLAAHQQHGADEMMVK
jgi:hypothetical protein